MIARGSTGRMIAGKGFRQYQVLVPHLGTARRGQRRAQLCAGLRTFRHPPWRRGQRPNIIMSWRRAARVATAGRPVKSRLPGRWPTWAESATTVPHAPGTCAPHTRRAAVHVENCLPVRRSLLRLSSRLRLCTETNRERVPCFEQADGPDPACTVTLARLLA